MKLINNISFKSIAGIVLMLCLFAFALGQLGYNSFSEAILEQYITEAFNAAETADDFVNTDKIPEYIESEGTSPEYTQTLNRLNRICNSFGATFIYVIIPDMTDYKHITFIFSGANENNDYTVYDFGYVRETTNEEYSLKYCNLMENGSDRETVIRNTGYIETDPHITAMIPLKDSSGTPKAILCVQRQLDVLESARKNYISDLLSVLIAILLLAIIAVSIFLRRTILDPLDKIAFESSRFAVENTPAEYKLTDFIRNKDEIGQLAGSIDQMEEQILEYVDNLTAVTADKERMQTELSLAARIQQSMLPNTFPAFPDRSEFEIYASMKPAKQVGGDFYDFFLIDDSHLGIAIADVSDKGIPAALFMMSSRIMIKNYAMTGMQPDEVLMKVNEQICSNNPEDMFVTVWLGILDLKSGTLKASNAGHEYPILKKPDGQFDIMRDKHGMVLGAIEEARYTSYEIEFKPGSNLFVYTDGLAEASNKDMEQFGMNRTLDTLNSCSETDPVKLIIAIENAVADYVGNAEQFDDMTMLSLLYNG